MLTFNPGQTSQTISVTILNDRIDEFDESFFVNLSGALNAEIGDNQGLGTIIDNDAPPAITIADTSISEGQSGTKVMTFTLTLAAPSEKPVSVNYSTANGTAIAGQDYIATNGTVQFQPGQTTRTVNVQILGDQIVEANETLFLNLTSSIFATIADNQAIGTILNDDADPLLSVTASPAQLWPPNHRLVPIQVIIQTSDDSGIPPTVRILSVTANEPINGRGDGNTDYDYEITADGRVFLRAERSGNGNERIYTLTYQATDNAGNVTLATTTVRVPKSQGN
ncbi:hypothetical protein IQ250_01785 [Pseudanabaenaceae cyanobacterium LEGE 13415]|nr:hypothetical protein [Pseudanabaenaceae cyanobacterium LEGE 13415]